MHIGVPQLIIIILYTLSVGIHLVKDGEPQGNYSFITSLIGTIIVMAVLKWGGFFG